MKILELYPKTATVVVTNDYATHSRDSLGQWRSEDKDYPLPDFEAAIFEQMYQDFLAGKLGAGAAA